MTNPPTDAIEKLIEKCSHFTMWGRRIAEQARTQLAELLTERDGLQHKVSALDMMNKQNCERLSALEAENGRLRDALLYAQRDHRRRFAVTTNDLKSGPTPYDAALARDQKEKQP